jgi:hypothetical protein
METSQAVKMAIFNMGGATLAGMKLQVGTNAVHKWCKRNFIPRLDKAEIVARESGFDVALLRPRHEQQVVV